MMHCMGSLSNKNGMANGLNVGSFLHGYALLSFDLTRAFQSGDSQVMDVPRISDLQIRATLKEPAAVPLSFIFILVHVIKFHNHFFLIIMMLCRNEIQISMCVTILMYRRTLWLNELLGNQLFVDQCSSIQPEAIGRILTGHSVVTQNYFHSFLMTTTLFTIQLI